MTCLPHFHLTQCQITYCNPISHFCYTYNSISIFEPTKPQSSAIYLLHPPLHFHLSSTFHNSKPNCQHSITHLHITYNTINNIFHNIIPLFIFPHYSIFISPTLPFSFFHSPYIHYSFASHLHIVHPKFSHSFKLTPHYSPIPHTYTLYYPSIYTHTLNSIQIFSSLTYIPYSSGKIEATTDLLRPHSPTNLSSTFNGAVCSCRSPTSRLDFHTNTLPAHHLLPTHVFSVSPSSSPASPTSFTYIYRGEKGTELQCVSTSFNHGLPLFFPLLVSPTMKVRLVIFA